MTDFWEPLFATFSMLASVWAAHLWFRASKIELPPSSSDSWDGKGPFSDALAKQSAMNARAAYAAVFAAFFQALSIASKVLGPVVGLTTPH